MSFPQLRRHGDAFEFVWLEEQIGIGLDHLHDSREGLIAEITIESTAPGFDGHVHGPARLNLLSTESQNRLAKVLGERVNHVDWHGMLGTACYITAERFRAIPPPVDLAERPEPGPVEQLAPGLPKGETIMLYGDGESGKSLLALVLAISLLTGAESPWMGARVARPLTVMYLDWETNERTVNSRLRRIARGLSLEDVPRLLYREMQRPLVDTVDQLRADRDRLGIDVFVGDSISYACSGSLNDDDVARGVMNALRQLSPSTRIGVTHVSQETARSSSGAARPFGSAFFWNGMRSGFEIRRADDGSPNAIELGIYHRKTNDLQHARPFGLRVSFDGQDGPITFSRGDLADSPDLLGRTPLSVRIRSALRGGALDTKELAEEAGVSEGTIRSAVRRMPDVIQLQPGGGGGSTAIRATWGLRSGE